MQNVVCILLIVAFLAIFIFSSRYEKLSKCGEMYVIKTLPKKNVAGQILCALNGRVLRFKQYLVANYPDNENVMRFARNYADGVLTESDQKTYTINKGKEENDKIHICLRNPQTGSFYNMNTLMFVILHEITHMIHPEFHVNDHPPEFWKMNIWVLKEAEKCGIYHNVDYSRKPIPYCDGIFIDRNPVFF